ncbi:acyl-coenzyme A thioesterase 13-like [Lolium rigidum]|uniref:acyl-coenzyme A thioesterase 13-like n=1 Tax=Lolium rigidum TaxID=89674 RepID=UPI001F5D35A6|nr:acyl-coenzyme A thioesterase 13-like [Lolium rigidum]
MDPEAVRRTLEPTASPEDISGSTPYDSFVISGVRLDAAEHGRVLFSFVVTPRHANSQGYLLSGVTATLADQLGSAAIFSSVVGLSGVGLSELGLSGLGLSGVSLEISVSYLDTATVGDEIEVEVKLLRAGKSVGVVSVDFRKKRTGKLIAQARHTKYLAVSSKL